ncbi:hypothetical protein RIF29_20354 [Crotalaria pallida]|uniref:Uncharacterized protein n=1 Tax=Crotalaria pallida TaxID=3830 RepID=A0AAN9F4B8_CROPI
MSGNPLLGFVEHGEEKGEGSSVQQDDLKKRSTKKVKRDGTVTEDDVCMEEVVLSAPPSSPNVVKAVHNETKSPPMDVRAQRSYRDSLMQPNIGDAGWDVHQSDDEELSENRCCGKYGHKAEVCPEAAFGGDISLAPPVSVNGGNANSLTICGNSNVKGKSINGNDEFPMIPVSSSNHFDYVLTENPKLPTLKESSPFGPWMMVHRPPRFKGKYVLRDPKREESKKENISLNIGSGSRFNALEIDNEICEENTSGEHIALDMQESCKSAPTSSNVFIAKGNSGTTNLTKSE